MRLHGKKRPPPIVATHRPSFVNNVPPPPQYLVRRRRGSQTFQRFQDVVALVRAGSQAKGPGEGGGRRSWVYSLVVIDACRLLAAQMGRSAPERRFLRASCLGPTHLLRTNERGRHSVTVVCHFPSHNGIL